MVIIDLINDNSIEIGANYEASFKLCNAPDLSDGYSGYCQIRTNNQSNLVILSPRVNIVSKDLFTISIAFNDYPVDIIAGNYQYDVLFASSTTGNRFYAVGGKIQIIKRITTIT
jgi:hypothetical protein